MNLANRCLKDLLAGFNTTLWQYEFLYRLFTGERNEHVTVGNADNYPSARLALTDSGWL